MMINDDFDRKMAFIADQQAQFAAGMQELRDLHAETEKARAYSESIVARLAYATLEGFKDVNAKVDSLIDSHIRMENAMLASDERFKARIDQVFATMAASHNKTDEQLQKLTGSHAQTEEELRKLAASHAQTEEELQKLAGSHAQTEEELRKLAGSHAQTEEELRKFIRGLNGRRRVD
jgi:Glu-tRNA(Gln) amidotransferase subunit E-like FAD-binding protein